ncbi:hypothetical protein [Brachybacterium hainanense]|uniref:Transcriptional regulator n=1 Tax=Brachybacterium hainanense TaxID=1541174 RepID=A0ABV6R6V4_9MICO
MGPADRVPFPLLAQVPRELRGVILDFRWDLARLHALDLPAREVATEELAWHLPLPFWAADGAPFQVSPMQVMRDPARYADQWRRTLDADLDIPLDCRIGQGGRLTILDGVHRLLKATASGRRTVEVRVLSDADLDRIAVPRESS